MTKNDDSKIITLVSEFKNKAELKAYCTSLYNSLTSTLEDMERLKAENAHLKLLLQSSIPLIGGGDPLTDEEIVCINQIERLKKASQMRELSIDEVKKLDLLYKNLRLIRGQSTSNVKNAEKPAIAIDSRDLLAIASSKDSDE